MATDRLALIEQKLQFIMQTLSLTRRSSDGSTDSRSLAALFQEMHTHVGTTPPTLADVAQRAFATDPGSPVARPPSRSGPDGFSGTDDDDATATTG
jgi:hypothetical protein